MGRLAGFTAADVVRKLRRAGFVLDRQAKSSHQIWFNPRTQKHAVIPRHSGDLPEGTVRSIVSQSGLTVDEFLGL